MSSVTELLQQAADGDQAAAQALYAQLYPEIKRIARARLHEVGGVTDLNPTALVHEGFLKLADREDLREGNRSQYLAFIGQVLRSVVIDHLRARHADKRGGQHLLITLSHADDTPAWNSEAADLLDIDRGLQKLQGLDRDLYELVELSAFAGMSLQEIATLRAVSVRTVNRDLLKARLLLADLLDGTPPSAMAPA
ncbi:ECF-type sigma factor [Ideonella sp.]|uniref:ECF-type sigma factor n=1 Tax=Ideonella sp. TaxID=1929293 RepID=UPI003BB77C22